MRGNRFKILFIILFPLFIVVAAPLSSKRFSSYLFGETRGKQAMLPEGNVTVPNTRTLAWQDHSRLADSIYQFWADEPYREWDTEGKMHVPRKILGNLLLSQNLPEVNNYITGLQPRGNIGSKWLLNPSGDYDFTLATLTTILYLFDDKPEVLYPNTKEHLVEVLLTAEGDGFTMAVPNTLGRIKDSENHVLMGESSRYLKNRYRMLHGNEDPKYDNEKNGMEAHILELLHEITRIGLYEFNSRPYLGYTFGALLNLEAFGSENVREAARDALDFLNYGYALGSYKLRFYPPFRRLFSRSADTSLERDYHTVYMKTWLSYAEEYRDVNIGNGKHQAIIGACLPYRPADEVVKLIADKGNGYFVKMGHGRKSSPEIYSAGPGYLISAGGVNRGKKSNIVARPVCLFLDDDVQELSGIFHINGESKDFMEWNNTGVYKNFACSDGAVHVPGSFKPASENTLWKVYAINDSLTVGVHSSNGIGIISVFDHWDPENLAGELLKFNSDREMLKTNFRFPGGSELQYDVNAPKNRWVIISVDGIQTVRDYDKWPLLSGEI